MNKVILADNQAIFRAGTAKVLAMEDDIRIIAQCADGDRLFHAVDTFRGAVVVFAGSLRLDVSRLTEHARLAGSRVVVIAENSENGNQYITAGVHGVVYRSVTGAALIDCVRRIIHGDTCVQAAAQGMEAQEEDLVGARVRDRLTAKEMKIVALIVQGCKNKEIAIRLGTTEQVIKNYLRSVYDKTGVSDRLELALFTIHHRMLAEAAAEAGNLLQMTNA
ncbi:MAG TPA: response regulator transcription factor [Acidisarcina sp.]